MEHTWIKVEDWKELPKGIVGIYRLTCPCGKIYIGKSENCIRYRWADYAKIKAKGQTFLSNELKHHNEISKWKIDYMKFPKNKCNEMEIELIRINNSYFYDNKKQGLNGTRGGDGNIEYNDEIREKMRNAKLGKKQSKEHKEKCRLSKIGHYISQETRDKIGKANSNKKFTEEHKEKLRIAKIGVIPWNKNKKMSMEIVEKNRLGHLGQKRSNEVIEKWKISYKLNREKKLLEKNV